MNKARFAVAIMVVRFALGGMLCAALAICSAGRAAAQEIEPYDFVPLPAGTNLAIGYYLYAHNTEFNVANGGPSLKNSKLEVNLGIGRYVHFIDVAGHPAGFEIIQPFGSVSGANVGGQRVGSAFGAQNVILSAFIFPYVNTAAKTNVITLAWLYTPTGTYDRNSAINLGSNRWEGDIQFGLNQGFGEYISVDLSAECRRVDARSLSTSLDPERGWGDCAYRSDPCNTAAGSISTRSSARRPERTRTRPRERPRRDRDRLPRRVGVAAYPAAEGSHPGASSALPGRLRPAQGIGARSMRLSQCRPDTLTKCPRDERTGSR